MSKLMSQHLFSPLALLLTTSLLSAASAQKDCRGSQSSLYDVWCQANCNHVPPFCPADFCTCMDNPVTLLDCQALPPYTFDDWCTVNCNHIPPFCPANLCECGPLVPTPPLLDIEPFVPTCCVDDLTAIFYTNGSRIFRLVDDGVPEVCYDLGGQPTSIVFDAAGNMYVADPVTSIVYRLSPDCNASSIEVLTSWAEDGIINHPNKLVIVPDSGLLISGDTGLYQMIFRSDGTVFSIERVNGINDHVNDLVFRNGLVYFINDGTEILTLDLALNLINLYLDLTLLGIPVAVALTINECGLFIAADVANLILVCVDLSSAASCRPFCDPSVNILCPDIVAPAGLASGCCCDIYVASSGMDCIVEISNVIPGNPLGPLNIEPVVCGLDQPQTVAFYSTRGPSDVCVSVCT